MNKSKNTNYIISLYKRGLSTYRIASILHRKQNSIYQLIRNHNCLRKQLPIIIENLVVRWLENNGKRPLHQKGDSRYDIILNNIRIDIKMSSLIKYKTKTGEFESYYFELKHDNIGSKDYDYHDNIDIFYLVLYDKLSNKLPIYEIESKYIQVKKTLAIPKSLKTKYPINLIGFLESEVKK